MMCSLSQIKELFTRPIVLPRLAAMLAFNLSLLCGPKAANLKIKDPRRLHWNPRSLLSRIVSLFIALGDNFDFISALVSDTRSFTPETMQRATVTLKKHAIRSEADIKRLEDLALKISSIKMTSKEEPENIPDEFLDPLLYTLMRDPVILSKTSRVTVDRTTITAHLLNDPTDPFNRQPVSPEDLIPDTDLKTRIESFLSSTKN